MSEQMIEQKYLSDLEVAELLGVSKYTVRRLAYKQELPGFKVGKAWRFSQSTLDAYLKQANVGPNEKAQASAV